MRRSKRGVVLKRFLGSGLLALLGLLGLGAASPSRQAALRPEELASIRAAQPVHGAAAAAGTAATEPDSQLTGGLK